MRRGIKLDNYLIRGRGIKGYARNIPRLKKVLRDNKYDIIHAHYGLSGIISDVSRKKEKLIVTFMGSDLLGSVNKKGIYTGWGKVLVAVNRAFSRYRYDFNIVRTKAMKAILKKSTNVEIVPNGVDFTVFYPMEKENARKRLGITDNNKMVLFISDPDNPVKNFSLAKRAFESLRLENSELKVVCGQTHEALNLYYNAADLLLFTSFHEGSPNVIKEAMACNCPIVSTDVGDVRDITGKIEGTYLCSFDARDVSEKIGEAVGFGRRTNGREMITHLEVDRVAKRIIDIYGSVHNSQ